MKQKKEIITGHRRLGDMMTKYNVVHWIESLNRKNPLVLKVEKYE